MAKFRLIEAHHSIRKVVGLYLGLALSVGGLVALTSEGATAQGIAEVGPATTFASGNSGSPATALPTGTAAGDVLVSYIETYPWVTVTCPKGWTKVFDQTNGSMTRLTGCVVVASAGQPKPEAKLAPATQVSMVTAAFAGVNTAHPVDTSAVADSLTSPSVVTTSPDDELVLGEASSAWRAVARAPAGSGLAATVNDRGNSQVAMALAPTGTAGPTAAATWTVSDSQWNPVSGTIALVAATTAGDPPPVADPPTVGTSATTAPPTTAPPTTLPTTTAAPTTAPPTTAPPTTTSTTVDPPTTTSTTAPVTTTTEPSGGGNCTNPVYSSSDASGTVNVDPAGYWWVNNDAWSGSHGPQTIYVCNQSSWYAVSDQPDNGGQVQTYPDTEYDIGSRNGNTTETISQFNSITSTFSEAYPSAGSWDAGYDLWTDNWTNETMIWNQWSGSQSYWAQCANGQISGGCGTPPGVALTLDGVAYHFLCNGSTSACSANGNHANAELMFFRDDQVASGSVDILAAYQWEVAHGYAKSTDIPTQLEYGVEICATNGTETFPTTGLTFNVS